MTNPRKLAVSALLKIEKDNAYSNITLAAFLKDAELGAQDKALFSALVYGVLDRKITLDFVLSKFMKTPLKKTAPFTLAVLRTALFQIMYMDKIPESAAVNEAVKLIKKSKESRNAGFVNAVLRSVLREEICLPQGDTAEELSIKYSCPLWITESFVKDYGTDTARSLLEESVKAPPMCLRVNTTKTDKVSLKAGLLKENTETEDGDCPDCLIVKNGMDIQASSLYKKGYFYAQDEASQRAVAVLAPKKGERVLDMCAAPGGKSFTMACLMQNEGEIIACDLYEKRASLIAEGAKRLGLDIIKTAVADATEYDEALGKFDCILCDVPCSGLGVLRRKPDIKYKPECDFKELEEIQYRILKNAFKYLKKGGRILYSTCTLRREENENLVIRFQKEYNTLSKVYEHTFMPHIDKTDGFYCALLKNTLDKTDIKSMTAEELEAFITSLGQPKFRAGQIFKWLHSGVSDFEEMTNIPKNLRETLKDTCYIAGVEAVRRLESAIDGTVKYVYRLFDGEYIESVFMKYEHGHTVCISTQVGCRMGCGFCASGLQGLTRNLTASEMLSQITYAGKDNNVRISNVVMMGMGEPLDNFDNSVRFLELVSHPQGLNIGLRHISLSTSGVVSGIERLKEYNFPVTLSISLHAPNDEIRGSMMPVNKKWNIDALLKACKEYQAVTTRRISFEYALIDGVNDSEKCADELARRLKGIMCHVNLIPANPVKENSFKKPDRNKILKFQKWLTDRGVNATVRRTLGADIEASCGQLRKREVDSSENLQ